MWIWIAIFSAGAVLALMLVSSVYDMQCGAEQG